MYIFKACNRATTVQLSVATKSCKVPIDGWEGGSLGNFALKIPA